MRSPDFEDVLTIWDSYHANHAQKVCAPLLALCATMMTTGRDSGEEEEEDGWEEETTRDRLALDSLARAIMTRRMRHVYSHLGSGIRARVNAALMVLAATARRGRKSAAELFRTFDFTLAALPKIAAPPREFHGKEGGASTKRRREPRDVLAGSTRRAFCEFVLSFFAVKDNALLRPVLAQRVLFGNVARFAAGDDYEMQRRILRVVVDDVISDGSAVPARLRAALFGDVTLEQLATMAGQSEDETSPAGQVASMATNVLVRLFTDPAHGLVQEKSAATSKKCASVVRLLQKLRPIECDAHLKILLTSCEKHPALATMYLPGARYALEPRLSAHWLASASVLGRIAVAAGRDASSCAAAARLDGITAIGESEGSTYVRAVIPPGVTKSALSKGLAHASPIIRHASLCLLVNVVRAVRGRLAHLNAAIKDATEAGKDRVWRLEELASYARLAAVTFLPEAQSIVAAYAACKATSGEGKDAALLARCHALDALATLIGAVPEMLLDAKVDLHKLLPANDPTSLPPPELAAVVNVLCASRGLSIEDMDADDDDLDVSTHDSGVNQGHLLSALRVVMFATSAEARSAARRLARRYLATSGALDGRASEAEVWIDKLTLFNATDFEFPRDVLMYCTEFLAEATTTAARRRFKHDATIRDELKAKHDRRPRRYSVPELTEEHVELATASVSALAVTVAESVGKVMKSAKRSPDFKSAVASYAAATLTRLVQTCFDPWALAACVRERLGDGGEHEDEGGHPIVDSLRDFMNQCLDDVVTMPSTKRERDGLDDLNLTLDRLASLSPTERGAALFSYHARASDADLTRGDAVAVSMYGSSARRGDEDRDVATKTSLLDGLDVVSVVTACACGPSGLASDDIARAAVAREFCARAVATCPTRLVVPATRAVVFWCKQSLARGDAATARRALSLAHAALNRARAEASRDVLRETRRALFAPAALYVVYDDETCDAVARVAASAIAAGRGGTRRDDDDEEEGEEEEETLYAPYVRLAVERARAAIESRDVSAEANVDVSLLALATNDEKDALMQASEDAETFALAVKIASVVAAAASASASTRARAVRLAVRIALNDTVSDAIVADACAVASRAVTLGANERVVDGTTPDFAAVPEALPLVRRAVENPRATRLVALASDFVARSDALAVTFVAAVTERRPSRGALAALLPLARSALRWDALYASSTAASRALAEEYRDLLMDACFFDDGDESLKDAVETRAVDALASCVKIAPLAADDSRRDALATRAMPPTGWNVDREGARARVAVDVFLGSDEPTHRVMLATSLLRTLAATTTPTATGTRDVSTEKRLAESLTRALEDVVAMDARTSSVDANALDSLVRAAEEFTTQSVTHKFRAHRRFAVVGETCAALETLQTSKFEMKSFAERTMTRIVTHPLFERAIVDARGDPESALPSTVEEMSSAVKSVVEVATDASMEPRAEERSNASALKLEILRALRTLWRMQHADGANASRTCRAWRAQSVGALVTVAAGYGATMSETDRLAHAFMLDVDASTGGGALRSLAYLWGESVTHFVRATVSVRRHENEDYDVDDVLYSDPSPALVAAAIREGSPPDARRAAATASRYPIHLTTPMTEVSFRDSEDECVTYGYDPSWTLPFTLRALRTDALEPREAIAWGLVSLAAAALSSRDENTRKIACAILATVDERVRDPLVSFRERAQVVACLSAMRNAVTTPAIRWSSPSAMLAAECLMSCLYPETETFLPLQRQLNKRAALDLDGLPMFLPMLNSGDAEARHHRLWILRLLRASLKDDVDATIFRKNFALEVIMSHHTTTLAEPFVRFLMLDLVARACELAPAARPLVEGGGLIAWLASVARTVCTPDKCGIRSNDNTALRVATAKAATKALVTLIRHKGSIYLGPTGTAADYLSALQTIRAAILSDDGVDGEGNALKLSRGDIAAKQAALGPYLKLHAELAARLRRRLAEVADPVEIANLCRAVDRVPDARKLRGDMFDVIVTSEGGGQYARRCTRETRGALANAVTRSAAWAAAHAADVSVRVSVRAGQGAFEKTARWCASALANGEGAFVNALLCTPGCGGASRFAALMARCEQSSGDEARRALRLPIIAAQFYIVRATHARDINDANTLSETDESMARALDAVDASVLAPGGALDKIIAASATGDSDAAAIARGFLRSILIGIEDETNGFARLVVEKTTTHVDVRKRKIDTGSRKRARSDV